MYVIPIPISKQRISSAVLLYVLILFFLKATYVFGSRKYHIIWCLCFHITIIVTLVEISIFCSFTVFFFVPDAHRLLQLLNVQSINQNVYVGRCKLLWMDTMFDHIIEIPDRNQFIKLSFWAIFFWVFHSPYARRIKFLEEFIYNKNV